MPRRGRSGGLTPAQANYQPLQLENFAQPLAQMQKKYDTTVNAFEDAEFGIDGLSPDSKTVKKLSGKLAEDRDAVLEELKKTKNYKQAAKKLKKLNKVYNTDEEISGIRSQKAAYKAEEERQKERLKKGDIEEQDFLNWRNKTLADYSGQGGYGYDRDTGIGRGIRMPKLEDNLEDEIQKVFTGLAKGMPANKWTEFQPLQDAFGFDEVLLKRVIEAKEGPDKAARLKEMVSQNKNYQNYLDNRAMYDWFNKNRTDENFDEKFVSSQIQKNRNFAKRISNNPNYTDEEKKEYIEAAEKSNEQILQAGQEAANNGKFNEFAETLFKTNYADNALNKLTGAAGNMYEFTKVSSSLTDMTDESSKSSKKTEKIIEQNGNINMQTIVPENPIMDLEVYGGTGSSNTEFQANVNIKNQELVESLSELEDLKGLSRSTNSTELLLNNYESYNSVIEDTSDEISNIDNLLSKTEERELTNKEVSQSINNKEDEKLFADKGKEEYLRYKRFELVKERDRAKINKEEQFYSLNNVFEDSSINNELHPELKRVLNKDGMEKMIQKVESVSKKMQSIEEFNKLNEVEKGIYKEIIDSYNNNMEKYYNEINTSKAVPTSKEITVNDNFVNIVGEENINPQKNIISNLKSGDIATVRQVNYNSSTGVIENEFDEASLDMDTSLYDLDNIRYVGTDTSSGDNIEVYRVNRDKMSAYDWVKELTGENLMVSNKKDEKRLFNEAMIKVKKDPESIDTDNHWEKLASEVYAANKNSPKTVTLGIKGNTGNILRGASDSFVNVTKENLVGGDQKVLNNLTSSYANIAISSDSDMKRDYNEMSVELRNIQRNKDKEDRVRQYGHTYLDNGDGTLTHYVINYKYSDENNGIGQTIAKVYKRTIDNNGDTVSLNHDQTIPLNAVTPAAIKKISLTFGGGNQSEKIFDKNGNSFVPAFQVENFEYNK